MKKVLLFISIFAQFFTVTSQVMWQFNKDKVVTWNYYLGDEFNGKEIDTAQWTYTRFGGRSIYSNREQQYYTDGKNHVLENGVYKILVKKEEITAKTEDDKDDNDSLFLGKKFLHLNKYNFQYTSEKLESRVLFTQGFFEIRFKAPKDQGLWPAFWLYGGYPDEEIDIMELKGERPGQIHVDSHCGNDCDFFKNWYGKKVNWGGWVKIKGKLSEGYNIIAGEWQGNYIKYYLNGECIAYVPVSFAIPKTLQVNVAVAGDNAPFHPGPQKKVAKFDPMEIDYIRIWNLSTTGNKEEKGLPGEVKTKLSEAPQGSSKIKIKRGFLYWNKSVHELEGPQVSLILSSPKNYIVFCNGLKQNMKVTVTIFDVNNKEVFSSSYGSFQNELKLDALSPGNYTMKIKCNGQEVSKNINL